VRVGVVLDEDRQPHACVDVPSIAVRLTGPEQRDLTPGAIRFERGNGTVICFIDGEHAGTGPSWSVEPVKSIPLAQGSGLLLRDVIAGRGFHWQKRVNQHLPGKLTFTPGPNGLVVTNTLGLEDYLACVITSEMGSRCPSAMLAAQCITARSWLLAHSEVKHLADGYDCCNDDCCQRYQGTGELSPAALKAARSTRGQALLAGAIVVDANYSKSCGGIVETPWHVWGVDKPGLDTLVDAPPEGPEHRCAPLQDHQVASYLKGEGLASLQFYCSPSVVPEESLGDYLGHVDEAGAYFRWAVTLSRQALETSIRTHVPAAEHLGNLQDLRVIRRGVSGRATAITLTFEDAGGLRDVVVESEYRIRQALHTKFLYSSAFVVESQCSALGALQAVTLYGAGWGHGAGLCQIGAVGMALRGCDAATICKHYFPKARLESVYAEEV
jgi:SpoIID/LytB domain protein